MRGVSRHMSGFRRVGRKESRFLEEASYPFESHGKDFAALFEGWQGGPVTTERRLLPLAGTHPSHHTGTRTISRIHRAHALPPCGNATEG
jgi:hypothetical protein